MKTKLIKYLAIMVACVFGLNLLIAPSTYADDPVDPICGNDKISAEIKAANGCPGTNAPKLEKTVINILNAIIAILGLVAVVFVIVGGVQYMTSTGDPGKVKKAKDTILYALIGLAVCVASFAIVNWAIDAIGGGGQPQQQQQQQQQQNGNNPGGGNGGGNQPEPE